jgi:hypothetical protein
MDWKTFYEAKTPQIRAEQLGRMTPGRHGFKGVPTNLTGTQNAEAQVRESRSQRRTNICRTCRLTRPCTCEN